MTEYLLKEITGITYNGLAEEKNRKILSDYEK